MSRTIILSKPENGYWIVQENGRFIELAPDESLFAIAKLLIEGPQSTLYQGMKTLGEEREAAAMRATKFSPPL